MAVEQTLILAKPDAVERSLAGEIVGRFERRGMRLPGSAAGQSQSQSSTLTVKPKTR